MLTENSTRSWEYWLALGDVAVLAAIGVYATAGWPTTRRLALLVVSLLFVFSWFKEGFVRHDAHSLHFFAAMMGATVALAAARPRRAARGGAWPRIGSALWAPAALAATGLAFVLVAQPSTLRDVHNPAGFYSSFRDHLEKLRSPDRFMAQTRAAMIAKDRVDPATLSLLRGRTVHAFPSEAAIAWMDLQIRWRPFPVFQGYSAYTGALDDVNREFVRSSRAPERIARHLEYSPQEEPSAVLAMFCRYVQIHATADWQVLARGRNRCGGAHPLASVRTKTGAVVPVPSPPSARAIVFMRVHGLEPNLGDRVREFVFKDDARYIDYGDGQRARVAPGVGSHPIMLSVPRRYDYPPPFRMGLQRTKVGFAIGEGETKQRALRVDFYALPLLGPAVATSND
jgi:hypothetical protein